MHRTSSRLLHCVFDINADSAVRLFDKQFLDFLDFLKPSDLIVMNDSFVIQAHFHGFIRAKNLFVTFNLITQLCSDDELQEWSCLLKPSKKISIDDIIEIQSFNYDGISEGFIGKDFSDFRCSVCLKDGVLTLSFNYSIEEFCHKVLKYGQTPLPPYIKRAKKVRLVEVEEDKKRYQNVYAKSGYSVAAPTAGLHFDREMIDAILKIGVRLRFVRLDVGGGTFLPIRSEDIREHIMHYENYWITKETWNDIIDAKINNNRIIAVGTTTLRTIESFFRFRLQQLNIQASKSAISNEALRDMRIVMDVQQQTNLFIMPNSRIYLVDVLLTNFHMPKSTLFVLICAIVGRDNALAMYRHAIREKYRFFSYGDASLIEVSCS